MSKIRSSSQALTGGADISHTDATGQSFDQFSLDGADQINVAVKHNGAANLTVAIFGSMDSMSTSAASSTWFQYGTWSAGTFTASTWTVTSATPAFIAFPFDFNKIKIQLTGTATQTCDVWLKTRPTAFPTS